MPFPLRTLLAASLAASILASPARADDGRGQPRYSHVLLISVDGLHAGDLTRFLADPENEGSALKALGAHAVIYPNALTTAPSDSFPGMLAQVTGGTSRSTGVFYDDSYDRTLFAPGSDCQGAPGTEVNLAENLDVDLTRRDGGGTLGQPLSQIDPANLPLSNASGTCKPVYPHEFVRVNTIFEVIRAHGGRTAWSDKHPAYDILNGPSGAGIEDLYTPEINSEIAGFPGSALTDSFLATRRYDSSKVRAVLNQIRGLDSTGRKPVGVPTILGLNFQAVSVGQKLAVSGPTDPAGLVGGYADPAYTPNNGLAGALRFVDRSIGQLVNALVAERLYDRTLIIISAKHGQSPVDISKRQAISDKPIDATPGHAFHLADDVSLIWLDPATRAQNLAAAQAYLTQQSAALGIATLLGPDEVKALYQDPATDSRSPDFIAITQPGVIYTKGTKLAEHGGFATEDRNVALLVHAPWFQARSVDAVVETRQIAPTILSALGLDPTELQAVALEGTRVLPGLSANAADD